MEFSSAYVIVCCYKLRSKIFNPVCVGLQTARTRDDKQFCRVGCELGMSQTKITNRATTILLKHSPEKFLVFCSLRHLLEPIELTPGYEAVFVDSGPCVAAIDLAWPVACRRVVARFVFRCSHIQIVRVISSRNNSRKPPRPSLVAYGRHLYQLR